MKCNQGELGTSAEWSRGATLTTASCCMEDGSLGYPGVSTVTSRPLDSITPPWLAIPTTQL